MEGKMRSNHCNCWILDVYLFKIKTYTSRAIDYKNIIDSTCKWPNNKDFLSNELFGRLHRERSPKPAENVYVLKLKTYTQEIE